MAQFRKDPDALLDYKVDWNSWLGTSDHIVSVCAFVDDDAEAAGFRVAASVVSANVSHIIWLSAGVVGDVYNITSRIVTNAGRRNDQSFTIEIVEK